MDGARLDNVALIGRVATAEQVLDPGALVISKGCIQWVGAAGDAPVGMPRQQVSGLLVPGFVDLHVHGAGGFDFADGTAHAIDQICQIHLQHGTTALCATILTGAVDQTLSALNAIAGAQVDKIDRAAIVGVHLEGPFLNPVRAGAQPRAHLKAPDLGLMKAYLGAAAGRLKIVTLAPELSGILPIIEYLVENDVIVALGHSDATYDQTRIALQAGARLATHLFNAMRPFHHRDVGICGAVLEDPDCVTELIADGVHVSDPAMRLVHRLKGPRQGRGHVALVTDCTAALFAPPESARLGEIPVVVRDGAARLADGTLAGSILTMHGAFDRYRGISDLTTALTASSATPRRVLARRTTDDFWPIGSAADLLELDAAFQLCAIWRAGNPIVPV